MNKITQNKDKAQYWQERIAAQVQSGQTIRVFCKNHELNRHTFGYWKYKLIKLKARCLPGRFISITKKENPVSPSASKSPRIHLPNGVQIDLGVGLEAESVNQLIQKLCGVNLPPKDGHSAKP